MFPSYNEALLHCLTGPLSSTLDERRSNDGYGDQDRSEDCAEHHQEFGHFSPLRILTASAALEAVSALARPTS